MIEYILLSLFLSSLPFHPFLLVLRRRHLDTIDMHLPLFLRSIAKYQGKFMPSPFPISHLFFQFLLLSTQNSSASLSIPVGKLADICCAIQFARKIHLQIFTQINNEFVTTFIRFPM